MRRTASLVAVVLGLTLTSRLGAQATGLAVYQGGIAGGLTIGGEVGFPDKDYGEGTAYGARASLGLGPLGIAGVVSRWDPDLPGAGAETGLGGYVGLKVFGGPLIPLSVGLQGGVEYADRFGGDILHFPVGLGFALKIPNPALAIKPWVAPRLDILRDLLRSERWGGPEPPRRLRLRGVLRPCLRRRRRSPLGAQRRRPLHDQDPWPLSAEAHRCVERGAPGGAPPWPVESSRPCWAWGSRPARSPSMPLDSGYR